MKHLFADGADDRTALMDKAATLEFVVAVARRHEQQTGFVVLPATLGRGTYLWLVGALASAGPR